MEAPWGERGMHILSFVTILFITSILYFGVAWKKENLILCSIHDSTLWIAWNWQKIWKEETAKKCGTFQLNQCVPVIQWLYQYYQYISAQHFTGILFSLPLSLFFLSKQLFSNLFFRLSGVSSSCLVTNPSSRDQ